MAKRVAFVVVVTRGKGQQDLVDQHLGHWAAVPWPVFILAGDPSIQVDPDVIKLKRDKSLPPVTVLEYEGDCDEVTTALLADEQLKEFDAYLVLTADAIVLDPTELAMTSSFLSTVEPQLWSAQVPFVGGSVLWNRAAVQALAETKAKTNGTWQEYVSSAKLPTSNPWPNQVVSCTPSIVAAGQAIERGARIVTNILGGATLAFVSACHDQIKSPTKLPPSKPTATAAVATAATGAASAHVPRVLRGPSSGLPTTHGQDVKGGEVLLRRSGKGPEGMDGAEGLMFVTALFDIRSREQSTPEKKVCKTAQDYLRLGAKLLEWDVNLFLMVEPSMVGEIYQFREKLGLGHKTFIYPLEVEQSRYFPLIKKLEALYAAGRVPKQYWAPKDTALYVWCMMQKCDVLRRALALNVWRASKVYWIDFGIFHIAEPPKPSLTYLLAQLQGSHHDRLRFNMLRPLSDTETLDPAQFYSQLQQCFAGGFFGGTRKSMAWFIEEWEQEIFESTNHYPTLDQAMFGRIYNRHKDRFLPINGHTDGHRRLLQPRTNTEILALLRTAVHKASWDEANCLVDEIVPKPWHTADTAWHHERTLQMDLLHLVAQIDFNLTGKIHPNVATAIQTLQHTWTKTIGNSTDTKAAADTKVAVALSASSDADVPMDASMVARILAQLQGFARALAEQPESAGQEVDRMLARVGDFASRKSVAASLPCVNAMLDVLASARLLSATTKAPVQKQRRMPVWVLNLDRRVDRWRAMQQTFSMLGEERHRVFSEFRRYSAIEGVKQRAYLQSLPFWSRVKNEPINAIACTASHMKMWQEWADTPTTDDGQEFLVILEDDATLVPSFMRDMTGLQTILSAGDGKTFAKAHDFIWIGNHLHLPDKWLAVTNTNPMRLIPLRDNHYSQCIGGTFGYMVSKTGARLALELLKSSYRLQDEPIDVWLMRRTHDKIRHISPSRPCVVSDFYVPNQPYNGDIAGPNPAM